MAVAATLAIRGVHLLAMALLFGGSVLTWAVFRTGGDARLRAAETYEWLFWAGAGLLVVTGVGNLGALAPAVPDLDTAWGLTFGLKLVAVVGLLVGSSVRTLAVVRWTDAAPVPSAVERWFRLAYAATAGYLLVVVSLAEVLAHG